MTNLDSEFENQFVAVIQRAMHEIGYKARVIKSDETQFIESATSGLKVTVALYPPNTIQLSLAMSGLEKFTIKDSNEFNKKYRFGRSYISEPGVGVLDLNWHVSPDQEALLDQLTVCFEIWETAVATFTSELKATEQ